MPVFHRGTVRRSQFLVGRVSITLEIQAYDELCVPGLAAQWADQAGRRPFVGALTLELPTDADDEVLSWVAAGTPPIYFGFGSTPLTSPADTIAVITAACTSLADHVKMVEAVNHAAVFPACRAVVHHGGVGTTAAGLRAGVPSLALWVGLDQWLWAGAIECLKVVAARHFTATNQESLVADLRFILSPQCVTRARDVAASMTKSAESVTSAADLLEAVARASALPA
jgi:vancomycin aglycone glucosyltransferase